MKPERPNHTFYQLPAILQWLIAAVFALVMLAVTLMWIVLASNWPPAYLLFFLLVPLMQWFITPLFTLIGVYSYLSPMLLVYMPTAARHDLHNGTSFDYFFVMRGTPKGARFKWKMLYFYTSGLLRLIEKLEAGDIPPEIQIRGSSYFFSKSTLQRFGFGMKHAMLHEKLNILANYLDLIWMYSIVHGRLRFPSIRTIRTAHTTGAELLEQKENILRLHGYLKGRLGLTE